MFGRKPILDGVSARGLLLTLGLSSLGLLGLLATNDGGGGVNQLAWYALAAPAIGCLGGKLGLRFWPLGFVAPALWMGAYSVSTASSMQAAPTPFYAALVWTGLFAAGWAGGVSVLRRGWGGPGWLLLLSAGAAGLSALVALFGQSPPQSVVAFALDLSPVTCVMESAGLDWMRHASIYELAGSLAPDARTPYRGMLAGPLCLVVGWGLVMVVEGRARRRPNVQPTTDLLTES